MDGLVGGPERFSRPSVARGRVVKAPSGVDATMTVVLINYSAIHDYEVPGSQWTAQPNDLPMVGDRCVVLFDDDGDAWVPTWGRDV